MRRAAENANPTRTHHFICGLRDSGRLVRDYTQNIDCLEAKVGLSTDMRKGPGGRYRFRRMSRSKRIYRTGHERQGQDDSLGVECVLLHGSLHRLRCSNCPGNFAWHEADRDPGPPCPGCTKRSNDRQAEGKRATAIGRLRPDIVLYDEQDPRAELISPIVRHDQSLRPDVLLIMGTSLATHGVQLLIRDFAKVIHERPAGKVVFVNLTEPAKSWDSVIDYWVEWDCDAWVTDLVKRQPTLRRGNNGSLIPKILIDLTKEDGQLNHKSPGSSRENPIDLTL
ncbi:DHS-like NAD/FAD-binding domain-containing protein [Parathielavia hyrcaniae]|uniref:DHS-like NAD/FAD-binding domain-containing protein n=1 Tax=Parathielavia hyrcaniae TaxID=113614 RepID=A0AAN6PSC5_9PEZI|nr:DHS-like NAD/FAD-binding domain-containing protein [Parathielavia hyrcaniae]